jgi:hypothetical protein
MIREKCFPLMKSENLLKVVICDLRVTEASNKWSVGLSFERLCFLLELCDSKVHLLPNERLECRPCCLSPWGQFLQYRQEENNTGDKGIVHRLLTMLTRKNVSTDFTCQFCLDWLKQRFWSMGSVLSPNSRAPSNVPYNISTFAVTDQNKTRTMLF